VAQTLDADQEALTFFSFPIEKQEDTDSINPVDGTPDIWITGKATDGTVDADRQIVDPEWSAVALKEWAATGGNVRMAHDPRRPVGKGHDVQVTMDGHYVRSCISDPLAKHFIRTKVLNDYSVGISMPHIKFGPHKNLDPRGEATGGIITGRPDGLSKIAELSVVDRGSNFHSKFQITRKSAGGEDDFGFIGKMIGDSTEIARTVPPDLLAKVAGDDLLTKGGSVAAATGAQKQAWQAEYFPDEDLSVTFTPNDMARLMQAKFVEKHYADLAAQAAEKRDFDRGVGGGVDRDKLPDSDFAGPHRSFPIVNQSDVSDALGLAGHADDPDAVRARIRAIARRKGLSVPDENDAEKTAVAGALTALDAFAGAGSKEDALAALDTFAAAVKTAAPAGQEAATPDVTKEPGDAPKEPKPKPVRKAKKPKKMPPWLNKPKDGDGDGDSDDDDAAKSCKSAADHLWAGVVGSSDIVCSKCHTTPAQAAGVTASPMDPAPVGELMESTAPMSAKGATPQSASGASDAPAMRPVPAHREPDGGEIEAFERDAGMSDGDAEGATRLEAPTVKHASPEVLALLRFKSVGIDPELGTLHDLTCPAYHPDEVAKYHPFADLGSLIDEAHWQRKSLDAACGPLEHAIAMQELAAFALALKAADPSDVNDWRLEAHKAFRDANPGPGTYPTPGSVSPRGFSRPLITDGRSASSPGHSGPTMSPVVATEAPSAMSFDRPPLSAGQESPSPSFMKWDSGQYPDHQGMPVQLNYAHLEKERQRVALARMHEHLSRQFPPVCPLDSVDLTGNASRPLRGIQPEGHPVPATAGIGKADGGIVQVAGSGDAVPAVLDNGYVLPKSAAAAVKAEPEAGADRFADADVYKGFKRQRKKLGKKVLAGKMTVDEARAKMGRQFAQKAAEPEAAQKAATATLPPVSSTLPPGAEVTYRMDGTLTPDLIKAAVREALHAETVPLETSAIASFDMGPSIESAVTKAVAPLLEKIRQQDETYTLKLAETQRVIDAIADQPDPSTASFSGLAFQPARKTARPAGVTDIAEAAARARRATERELENLYESASDPFAREGFYSALNKVRGGAPNS